MFGSRRGSATVLRRLVVAALALALLAGCTSTAGTPGAESGIGSEGTVTGTAPSPSSVIPIDEPGVAEADVINGEWEPASADLIAAALAAGEIDEATSLLYRTWLFFGDRQLPERYIGAEAPYELGFLAEVRDTLGSMPADIRAQVEPYLLRPEDPDSAFNARPKDIQASGESDPPGLRSPGAASADALQAGELKSHSGRCVTGWNSRPVAKIHFRVWTCRDDDAVRGMSADEAMKMMAAILQEHVPNMTADMGKVIRDDPDMQTTLPPEKWAENGIDDRIDVYVLPSGWHSPYRANASQTPNYARAVQTWPMTAKTASSYVLVSLDHFDDTLLMERMVVHELFHVLHRTHNSDVDAIWWSEGSAEWAASYYVRSDSARLHEVRLDQVLDVKAPSILVEERRQRYGAYIWPLFMEQQAGAQSIFDAWRAMASLPVGAKDKEVIEVLSQPDGLDMAKTYPELAVRLVNMKLPGDPIMPRFHDLDSHFPDGRAPRMDDFTLTKDPLELSAASMFGLGYRDFSVEVEPPPDHPDGAAVAVRVTGTAQTESGKVPVLQALVRGADGTYQRLPVDFTGDGDKLCVSGHMILVLANNSTVKLDLTDGILTLDRLDDEPCSRIEASDPGTMERLDDTDPVAVEGEENDGEPDTAPLVISVFDVPREDVADYSVKVTLTGGTLAGARELTWPLADLEEIATGVYRMVQTVALDIDLTDANRDFTIDSLLLHHTVDGAVNVNQHTPTVRLHGLKQCGARVTYVTNEDPDDPLTMSWDCDGRAALLQKEGQTIIDDSGTLICSYEDHDCTQIPGAGKNMFPHLGFYMEVDEAQGLLTEGNDAGSRTIAGVNAACRTINAAGADGRSTWCVDPDNPRLLLYWQNLDTGETLTATAFGKPRPGDFVPLGAH